MPSMQGILSQSISGAVSKGCAMRKRLPTPPARKKEGDAARSRRHPKRDLRETTPLEKNLQEKQVRAPLRTVPTPNDTLSLHYLKRFTGFVSQLQSVYNK